MAADGQFVTRLVMQEGATSRFEPRTFTRWLGVFLSDIEAMLGPRDPAFTVLGIEFVDTCHEMPKTWFPDTHPHGKHVIVHLNRSAMQDGARARWQLAHECVHLIDPAQGVASVMEEGIATWFQNTATTRSFHNGSGPYAEAERLVSPVIRELCETIRFLRTQNRLHLDDIAPAHLQNHNPNWSGDFCRALTEPFSALK
ncbi:hypothetical protein [Ruegeria sp.]|uniref:hypothetical protein n=2 Tax=Ruegeria sp. TaxID=1879320 RepID=UPI003B008E11